jgi:hypothetical protein
MRKKGSAIAAKLKLQQWAKPPALTVAAQLLATAMVTLYPVTECHQ